MELLQNKFFTFIRYHLGKNMFAILKLEAHKLLGSESTHLVRSVKHDSANLIA